jgi:hypothetical protein
LATTGKTSDVSYIRHRLTGSWEPTRHMTDQELLHINRWKRKAQKERWMTEDAIRCFINECDRVRDNAAGFHNRGH